MKRLLFSRRKESPFLKFDLKMRLTTLILLVAIGSHANPGLAQKKISLSVDNMSIGELINQIELNSDYRFIGNTKDVDLSRKVSLNVKNEAVVNVLEKVFKNTSTIYKIKDSQIILIKKSSPPNIIARLFYNQSMITGLVKDNNGVPMMGVTVRVQGSNIGVATDEDGKYAINAEIGDVLLFSYVGFETKFQEIKDAVEINVNLNPTTNNLDEVVLVGYGSTKKRDLTGTVNTVKSSEIEQIESQTIDQSIAGRASGVYVNSISGQPGAGAIVHIRGLSALRGDNQPLYVVDGIPIIINPVFNEEGLGTFGSRENPLLAISPNDVERIDILKDASAAAIYGSRAANGVILITTKKGKRNQKPKFSFLVKSTISNPTNYWDVLSTDKYREFVTQNAQNRVDAGSPGAYDDSILNNPDTFFGNTNTDWQKEVTNKNALWNDYRFGFNGGTQDLNYLVSLGVSNQEGVIIGSKLNRYSLSTNLDANVSRTIKTGISLNYNYTVNKSSGIRGLQQSASFRPDVGVYDGNGQYTTVPAQGGTLGANVFARNPVGGNGLATNSRIGQYLFGSIYGEIKIIEALNFKSQISISLGNDRTSNFLPSFADDALSSNLITAVLDKQRNDSYATVFSNTLNYNKEFLGGHRLDAVVGISWDRNRNDLESQTYAGFPDDFILTNIGSAQRVNNFSSEAIEGALNSVFGRFNYNYKDRYLATFTARRDGSTKFGPNNKYGFFPSGALAWNIHNEDFFDSSTINQLKIRTSLGRTGNDNLASFTYLAYMSSLASQLSFYGNNNGIVITGLPNSDIRWEETDQLDIGAEFSLLNSRINGEIVYYEKNTSGIILYSPLPSESGFGSFNANVADVSNNGWEISLSGDILQSKKINWNSSFNISFPKGKVENLYGSTIYRDGRTPSVVEGYPIGVITGYDKIGIAQTQSEIEALDNEAPGGKYYSGLSQPGDYIYRDVDGDGRITTNDRTVIGNINPDYYGGWNNTLTYKNLDLNFNFQFAQVQDRQLSNSFRTWVDEYRNPFRNTISIVNDTWTPDNPDARYGRLGTAFETFSSTYVSDASYVRLKSASIGYKFPEKWLDKFSLTAAKITLSGNNLFTITNYLGLDPESISKPRGGQTTDLIRDEGYTYPITRTFTLGLNVNF
ncbi:MAG: hypothetical protein CL868_16710 [Cytophagaceae bacterium]|nr:hypothetical protein [Cytophagaceae bacterium]